MFVSVAWRAVSVMIIVFELDITVEIERVAFEHQYVIEVQQSVM